MRAVTIALLLCALPGGVLAQQRGATDREQIRVGLFDFVKQSGDGRFDILQSGLPRLLGLKLLADARVLLVEPDEISARLDRAGLPPRARLTQRSLTLDVTRALGVDFLLEGSYLEIQGQIMISASLHDLRKGSELKLELVRTNERVLLSSVESLGEAVLAALPQGAGDRGRSVAVACFEDKSAKPGTVSKSLRRDLAQYLAGRLAAHKAVRVAEWRKVEPLCEKALNDGALAKQLGVDAVIGGSLSMSAEALNVLPSLLLRDGGARFGMPSVKGQVADFLQLKDEIGQRIEAVLDGAIGSDGKWKIKELASKSDPAEDVNRGRELMGKGDLDLAVIYLARAAESSAAPDARYYLGAAQTKQGKFEDAAANLGRYIAESPASGPAHRELGLAYAGLRRYDEAIAEYERALKLSPELRGLHVDIGNAHFFKGKYGEAARHYREGSRLAPEDVAAHFNLGLVAERERDMEAAIAAYRSALRINPQYASARNNLADLYARRGDETYYDKRDQAAAVKEYAESLSLRATTRGYFGRALSRAYLPNSRPDYEAVASDYEEVLQRSANVPADASYRRATLLNLPEAYILAGRYREGEARAQLAVKEFQNDARDRAIARYLLVASQMLGGANHVIELELLRRDVAVLKERIDGWDFSLLDRHYGELAPAEQARRQLVVDVTEEFKRTAMVAGK